MPVDEPSPGPWFDQLSEGVVLIDEGVVRGMNAAAAKLLGVDRAWAAGRSPLIVLRDHRLERVWLHGQSAEVRLGNRIIAAVAITGGIALRDVSELRRVSENSRELLAVLSHELRTPITTVRATLDALTYDDLSTGERQRLIERAGSEAERVVRLIEDLTAEVSPPRERTVALESLVERACSILAPTLESHQVRVNLSLPQVTVWADPDKILQVLINLLENAALHGPDGAQVDVIARLHKEWAVLLVRDRGPALPLERFEGLFQEFSRAAGSGGRRRGLGLYIVRSVVARWGGRVWGRVWGWEEDCKSAGGNEFGVLIPTSKGATQRPAPGLDSLGLDEL